MTDNGLLDDTSDFDWQNSETRIAPNGQPSSHIQLIRRATAAVLFKAALKTHSLTKCYDIFLKTSLYFVMTVTTVSKFRVLKVHELCILNFEIKKSVHKRHRDLKTTVYVVKC